MAKVKELPVRPETVSIVKEMMKKHGPRFMSDYGYLTKDKPLFAGLCYYQGETKLTPLFSNALKATDFVEITREHVEAMKDVQVKIVKLTLV